MTHDKERLTTKLQMRFSVLLLIVRYQYLNTIANYIGVS